MSDESTDSKARKFWGIKSTRQGVLGVVDYIKFAAVGVLLFMMLGLVAFTTLELLISFGQHLLTGFQGQRFGEILLDDGVLLGFIGFILTIFIAIELAESVEVYLTENDFHGELVVLVALIAVSRKIILLEYDKYDPLVYLGIAGIVAALAWAYYMLKRSRRSDTAAAAAIEHGESPPAEAE